MERVEAVQTTTSGSRLRACRCIPRLPNRLPAELMNFGGSLQELNEIKRLLAATQC
jgi:hypothetical protein